MRQLSHGRRYGGAMTAGATGGLKCSPRRGCVANTAYTISNKGSHPSGAFLSCDGSNFPSGLAPVFLGIRNGAPYTPAASGHRGQRWGKVKGRQVLPPFRVSPRDGGKLYEIFTACYKEV